MVGILPIQGRQLADNVALRRDATGWSKGQRMASEHRLRSACAVAVVAVVAGLASPGAAVAVPPQYEQSQAEGKILFEVTGSGSADTIDIDPGGRFYGVTAPWSKTVDAGSDATLLQVVVVVKDGSLGCRITLDGKVVNEEPPGQAPHCIYGRY